MGESNASEDVKKTSSRTKLEGRVGWESLRAQPLEIEALCRKPVSKHILIRGADDL